MKPGSNCCWLALKATEEEEEGEETQDAPESPAAAKETSVPLHQKYVALFALKEEQWTTLKAVLSGRVFALLLTGGLAWADP